jgi:hypothetical protein
MQNQAVQSTAGEFSTPRINHNYSVGVPWNLNLVPRSRQTFSEFGVAVMSQLPQPLGRRQPLVPPVLAEWLTRNCVLNHTRNACVRFCSG